MKEIETGFWEQGEELMRQSMYASIPPEKIKFIDPKGETIGFNPWLTLKNSTKEKQREVYESIKSSLTEQERVSFLKFYRIESDDKWKIFIKNGNYGEKQENGVHM